MFRLKAIFFVAALCVSVVNSAVTVNIHDDGVKNIYLKNILKKKNNEVEDGKDLTAVEEDFQVVHDCNNQACGQLCRRLKFPDGVCVNGRCKCNILKQSDDVEDTLYLERSLQEARSCNNQACDQLCRRLKFPGGACVNGRFKCDNFKQPELTLENVKDQGSCDWRACDQLCRRLGFPGGVCVGDNCKCDNFRLNNNEALLQVNDLSVNGKENANECNDVACESYCQKLGLPSGYCYQDRCICYKKKEIDEVNTFQRCDVVACNEMCHRMNYIGGMCRNGSCYCY